MPIKFQKFIKRQDLRDNPEWIYLFGDNLMRVGMGGQAAEMRGEPNAYGIPTKVAPGNAPEDFFNDLDFLVVSNQYMDDFAYLMDALDEGKTIVIPEDGLGTGLADLNNKAPKIMDDLNQFIKRLKEHADDLEYELKLMKV